MIDKTTPEYKEAFERNLGSLVEPEHGEHIINVLKLCRWGPYVEPTDTTTVGPQAEEGEKE